jgi:hypothetical protein
MMPEAVALTGFSCQNERIPLVEKRQNQKGPMVPKPKPEQKSRLPLTQCARSPRLLILCAGAVLASCAAMVTNGGAAELCASWSMPVRAGALDLGLLREASGMAISRRYPDRMYHHNDSGDAARFFISDLKGGKTKEVAIPGPKPLDMEDVALGPCADAGAASGKSAENQCLFFADIGDNRRGRKNIELWILPELEAFGATAPNPKKISLKYPGEAHNAEAVAVHPATGDVYLLTKEADLRKPDVPARPAQLFRVPRAALSSAGAMAALTLEPAGEIDIPYLNSSAGMPGQITTAMDFRPDGKALLVLTYENAIEIRTDALQKPIRSREWINGRDYRAINWPRPTAIQPEAIAYSPDGRSFYFDTEYKPDMGATDAALMRVDCKRQ